MSLERIKYLKVVYFVDESKPDFYMFDSKNVCHVLLMKMTTYEGIEYTGEWHIPGTARKDISYAKRLALKISPWRVHERSQYA